MLPSVGYFLPDLRHVTPCSRWNDAARTSIEIRFYGSPCAPCRSHRLRQGASPSGADRADNLGGPVAVLTGTDNRTLKDSTGKEFCKELYAAVQKPEGQITEVSYMFPKSGTTAPAVLEEPLSFRAAFPLDAGLVGTQLAFVG
jgi:hypothetical protein